MTEQRGNWQVLRAALPALALLAACGNGDGAETASGSRETVAEPVDTPSETPAVLPAELQEVSAGSYGLEKTHASLLWSVSHNGLSNYTARFTEFDATLDFDPADPAGSTLSVTVNPRSVRTDHPDGDEWDTELATGDQFFNAGTHPKITFVSTDITPTGDTTGLITGDLTLLGVTRQITMDARYNGVGNQPFFGERDILGFSATATLNRSDFGMDALIPNIGDAVQITVEAEFLENE